MSENPTPRSSPSDAPVDRSQVEQWDDLSNEYEHSIPVDPTERTLVLTPSRRRRWLGLHVRLPVNASDRRPRSWVARSAITGLAACLALSGATVLASHLARNTTTHQVGGTGCTGPRQARPRRRRVRVKRPATVTRPTPVGAHHHPRPYHPERVKEASQAPATIPRSQAPEPASPPATATPEAHATTGEQEAQGGPFSP